MTQAPSRSEALLAACPALRPAGFWDGVQRSYLPPTVLTISPDLEFHGEHADSVDPVTREVIRYSLVNANFEHSALLQRLCVSPITMLSRDFQTSILTAHGDLVFLGPNLQYFSNSHSLAIKYILEYRSVAPGVHPGDVYLCNDPWVGAPHQPDTALLAPAFVDGKLFCWVANTLHHSDVGGSMPGSFCIDAADTFEEPVSWPPVKLIEAGVVRTDIEALFARQSRAPLGLRMDLRAAIAGIEATRTKLGDLVAQHGAGSVRHVLDATLDAGEQLFLERLEEIPDGRWSQRVYTEAAVSGDRGTYAYQVNLTKIGSRLIVDNAGTDPQVGAINLTFAAFAGAVLAAITQQMTADLGGAYGGVYRRVEFRPEPGLLNCADFPAAVSPSGALTTELQLNAAGIAVAKMLASGTERSREHILGPCVPHFYGPILAGATATGTPFIYGNTDGMMGSLGGTPGRDGVDTGGHYWVPDSIAANVEDSEAQYPLVVLYRRMLTGGADGAGRHRGGLGLVEASIPQDAAAFLVLLHENEAFTKGNGLAGANPGSLARFRHARGTDVRSLLAAGQVPGSMEEVGGEEINTRFKGPALALTADDVFEWNSPSTGGYGDPLLREPAQVLDDHLELIVTAEVAERVYGVVLRDGALDSDATAGLRARMRAARLGGRAAADPVDAPVGARRVGELLHIVEGRWWCNGADLGSAAENYKDSCVLLEDSIQNLAPEFEATDHEIAQLFVFRQYICPVTGYRIDCDIARSGESPLHDIVVLG